MGELPFSEEKEGRMDMGEREGRLGGRTEKRGGRETMIGLGNNYLIYLLILKKGTVILWDYKMCLFYFVCIYKGHFSGKMKEPGTLGNKSP